MLFENLKILYCTDEVTDSIYFSGLKYNNRLQKLHFLHFEGVTIDFNFFRTIMK